MSVPLLNLPDGLDISVLILIADRVSTLLAIPPLFNKWLAYHLLYMKFHCGAENVLISVRDPQVCEGCRIQYN